MKRGESMAPLQIIVVGTPQETTAFLPAWLRLPGCKVAVATPQRNPDRASGMTAFQFLPAFPSLESALAAVGSVDIVHLCSDTGFSLESVVRTLEAGADLLLPAPPASLLRSSTRLLRAARRHRVRIMALHPWRFLPGIARLGEWIESGVPGRVQQIELRISPAVLRAFFPARSPQLSPPAQKEDSQVAFLAADLAQCLQLAPDSPGRAEKRECQVEILEPGMPSLALTVKAERGHAILRAAMDHATPSGEFHQELEFEFQGRGRLWNPPSADPLRIALACTVFQRRLQWPEPFIPFEESARAAISLPSRGPTPPR